MPDLTPTPCPWTGRPTWPHFVQYMLTEGRWKGTVLDLPPDQRVFPAPEQGRTGGAAFALVIHDLAAYDALARTGRLYRADHAGVSAMEDERETS